MQNGRYGPYVKHGAESRSLPTEDEMFTVSLEAAKALLAEPKARGRGRAAAAPPLRELGNDPANGKPMVIKDGRFGPYVTDGETNASLRKDDEVATHHAGARRRAARRPAGRRAGTARAQGGHDEDHREDHGDGEEGHSAAASRRAKKTTRARKSSET